MFSAGGYDVNNSVRIRSSASAYFNRTPASAGNRQKFTYSVWHKSSLVNVTSLLNANSNSSNTDAIYFDSNKLVFESNVSGVNIMNLTTSQVFRDPSAWYHFVFSVDTTQATAANRIKIYVNGQQITVFTTATYPSQNSNLNINSNVAHNIGRFLSNGGTTYYSDGYYAETYFVDGQAKVSSDFGETDATTGVWKGMSAAYMAVEIINSGKNIKFDCIDNWEFVPDLQDDIPQELFGEDIYETFLKNIEPVKDKITPIKCLSWEGAQHYEDNSLDFVFLDAAHDYESVKKDINAYFPKIKQGGVIAGHDYEWCETVRQAVDEFFTPLESMQIQQTEGCWAVIKN